MILIKRLLLLVLILVMWIITTSCSKEDGCYGYWEDVGLKRGTIHKT